MKSQVRKDGSNSPGIRSESSAAIWSSDNRSDEVLGNATFGTGYGWLIVRLSGWWLLTRVLVVAEHDQAVLTTNHINHQLSTSKPAHSQHRQRNYSRHDLIVFRSPSPPDQLALNRGLQPTPITQLAARSTPFFHTLIRSRAYLQGLALVG